MLNLFLFPLTFAWWSLVFLSSGPGFSGEWTKRLLAEWFGLEGTTLEIANYILRKSWHVFYYFVLAFLLGITIRAMFSSSRRNAFFIPAFLALSTAIFDESRQAMSPSRTGTALDVLYDALGISIAVLLLMRMSKKA
ncbi:MAG TPA: VanZ family protein [Fimbriimonadales bacterium]|nr:VanZ family protein [Fimbriimonadales bacterium]